MVKIHPIRRTNDNYDLTYLLDKNANGTKPDNFILSELSNGHTPTGTLVLELGSGQGRNLFPIAQQGYRVVGYEQNRIGVICLEDGVKKFHLGDRVTVLRQSILDAMNIGKQKADFAFMSHLSQHFNPDQLRIILENVAQNLKQGGQFIFDALMRCDRGYKGYDAIEIPEVGFKKKATEYGNASFWDRDIQKTSVDAGFEVVRKKVFAETGSGRAWYETQRLWGGNGTKTAFNLPRNPVKLMWYVLRKK